MPKTLLQRLAESLSGGEDESTRPNPALRRQYEEALARKRQRQSLAYNPETEAVEPPRHRLPSQRMLLSPWQQQQLALQDAADSVREREDWRLQMLRPQLLPPSRQPLPPDNQEQTFLPEIPERQPQWRARRMPGQLTDEQLDALSQAYEAALERRRRTRNPERIRPIPPQQQLPQLRSRRSTYSM